MDKPEGEPYPFIPTEIYVPETGEKRIDVLKKYAAYDRTRGESYETEYTLGGKLPEILQKYGFSEYVKDADTKTDEIVFKILNFVCDHFGHNGSGGMPSGCKITDIIEFCENHEGKTNCRGLAILLASLLRLSCVRARHITCMPYEAPFNDCHVVVDCLLPSGKRIMLDPTWRLFLKDSNGEYVSLERLREMLIAGEPVFPNEDASYSGEAFDKEYYRDYMIKNTVRFSRGTFYKDGSDDHAVRRVELIPANYPAEKFRKAAKKEFVYNDIEFWKMGVGIYSMKCFELQPLRIFGGWTVKYNNFTEYDPQKDGAECAYELNEDLLWLERSNLWIDLGWYPAMDITGSYVMYLADNKRENPYDNPIEVFESKSKQEILSKLEYWMDWGHCGQYLR